MKPMKAIKVGVIAASSVVPKVELELGIKTLEKAGFEVVVHPSVHGEHWFYPAKDQERADALLKYAADPTIDILWCGRGGYGATNLLPLLKKGSVRKKFKKKIIIGYSDATALLEFARVNWKWKTLHAPMLALKTFSDLKPKEWATLIDSINRFMGREKKKEIYSYPLKPVYIPKNFKKLEAQVVGGNLSVWNAMIGTPYAGNARGKILFLEDLQENVARINRMLHHLEQSGGLKGVKAIVLGDFTECNDTVPQVFKSVPKDLRNPSKEELQPLRKTNNATESLHYIFNALGERTGIPIFSGAPIGHGENQSTLALGEKHLLNVTQGLLKL